MAADDLKEMTRRWYETINREDWSDHIDAFFATKAEADQFRSNFGPFRAAFPDYHFTIDHLLVDGDMVAIFGTVQGTHMAEFPVAELKGIPPSGKKLTWNESQWIRIKDGYAVDGGLLVDGVSRLRQLGMLPGEAA